MHRENQSEAATVKWPLRSCITEILCTVEFFFGKSSMEFLRAFFRQNILQILRLR